MLCARGLDRKGGPTMDLQSMKQFFRLAPEPTPNVHPHIGTWPLLRHLLFKINQMYCILLGKSPLTLFKHFIAMAGILVENTEISCIAKFDNPRRSLQDAHACFFDVLIPCRRNSGISPIACIMRLDNSSERGNVFAGTYLLLGTARHSTHFWLT
jgi:hypothetical protein